MQEQVDVCVVGGGIVGMFCALEQARRGKTVRMIDKIYSGSSRRNIGDILLHGQSASTLPFMKFTFEAWKESAEKFGEDLGFEAKSSAYLAYNDTQMAILEQEVEEETKSGFESTLISDLDQLASLLGVTSLPEDVIGAKISNAGGKIDTDWATDGLRRLLIQKGVRIWGDDLVTHIITEDNVVKGVRTNNGDECMADVVIVAAGVWSNDILKSIEAEVPIRPARCHLLEVSPTGKVPQHMLVHSEKYGDIMLKYQKSGRVLVSYTGRMDQAQATWSTAIDEECLHWLKENSTKMLTSMMHAKQQDVRAITTAITPDGHAYLGKIPKWENILIAAGFNGKSFAYAAGVAKLLGFIVGGEEPPAEIDMKAFRIDNERFKESEEERAKRMAAIQEKLARMRASDSKEVTSAMGSESSSKSPADMANFAGDSKPRSGEVDEKGKDILHPEKGEEEEWVDPFKRT